MANVNDVWVYKDDDNSRITYCFQNDTVWCCITNTNSAGAIIVPLDKVRELRDFLTAKLEGDDGRD